jgi:Tol biopolymer transport system component
MSRDGSGPRQLSNQGAGGHFLRWSRDGKRIFYKASPGEVMAIDAEGGEPVALPVKGGAHISLSPDESRVLDVLAHKELWVSPLTGGEPARVFEFPDPDVRIDYPVWSPDGHWVLFDRFRPQGGDIWVLEPVE